MAPDEVPMSHFYCPRCRGGEVGASWEFGSSPSNRVNAPISAAEAKPCGLATVTIMLISVTFFILYIYWLYTQRKMNLRGS